MKNTSTLSRPVFVVLLLLAADAAAQQGCGSGCLMGPCTAANNCPPVPVGTCIRIAIDLRMPFPENLPLNQRSGPSTSNSVVGAWSINDRTRLLTPPVFGSDFRTWFKLAKGAGSVWSAYGITRTQPWFEACDPPKPPTTVRATPSPAPPALTVAGPTTTMTTMTTMTTTTTTTSLTVRREDCANLFDCRACLSGGCSFCYDSDAFSIQVPGVCSSNCSRIAPRAMGGTIVELVEDAQCEALDMLVARKNESDSDGPGAVHYCLLPGTTCLRCMSRRGCQWCATGFCVNETSACDVPELFTTEQQCKEFVPLVDTRTNTVTTTAASPSFGDLELGLIIGGVLFCTFVVAAVVSICILMQKDKRRKSPRKPRIDRVLDGSNSLDSRLTLMLATPMQTYGQGASYALPPEQGTSYTTRTAAFV
jgi:hypothetical protein